MKIPKKRRKTGDVVLPPLHPNAGIQADYRRRLLRLVDEMQASVVYWLRAAYRKDPPRMAEDAVPATELQRAIQKLVAQWQHGFDEAAPELAKYFGQAVYKQTDSALRAILKKGGFSVRFVMTRAQRDILQATVNANVGLIKSIPQQYLGQVEGIVMRSVQTGRDLQQVTADLQKQFGVTRRRAELIARDQNAKATSALQRARQDELGITEAVWMHSGGGREPRPTHVKNSGKRYKIAKGWYDPHEGKYIWPGELINCRCVAKSVVPGFS